ncbi:hypothetical protein ACS0TY_006997 [Phlomoides rotata]
MKKGETSYVPNKLERKIIEKNRREQMKDLCFKLVSLIPPQHSKKQKKFMSQQDQVGEAVAYIKILGERVEELRRRKVEAAAAAGTKDGGGAAINLGEPNPKLPILEINELGSDHLKVVLISGANKKFMVHQIICIIEEEGAEVISVSISTIGDKIFHTLHAQVKISRVGVDTSRICERIHELVSL